VPVAQDRLQGRKVPGLLEEHARETMSQIMASPRYLGPFCYDGEAAGEVGVPLTLLPVPEHVATISRNYVELTDCPFSKPCESGRFGLAVGNEWHLSISVGAPGRRRIGYAFSGRVEKLDARLEHPRRLSHNSTLLISSNSTDALAAEVVLAALTEMPLIASDQSTFRPSSPQLRLDTERASST
jgi:hypothetical protein